MGDDDHRPREAKYRFLQYILRANIQMVCWFIQNKEVRRAKEELDEGNTPTLSSTKDRDLLL